MLGELCSPVAAAETPIAQDEKVPFIGTVPTAGTSPSRAIPTSSASTRHNGQLNKALVDYVRTLMPSR